MVPAAAVLAVVCQYGGPLCGKHLTTKAEKQAGAQRYMLEAGAGNPGCCRRQYKEWARFGDSAAPSDGWARRSEDSAECAAPPDTPSYPRLCQVAGCGRVSRHPVPETTLLFALLWRSIIVRHAHAASHGPSDTAGEHDTPTPPVVMRPHGRALPSESGESRTRTKSKNIKMTTKAALVGRNRLYH